MAQISAVKNALQSVVKKDRLLNAVFAGGKSFVVSISRTFYAFWLQTTGLMYVLFTVLGASSLVHEYYKKDHVVDHKRVAIEAIFTVVCFYFTVHSFVKASRTLKRKK
jgi:succinate dehydrogenase hydrophobic anchor subunit